jgi:hypothetical protein
MQNTGCYIMASDPHGGEGGRRVGGAVEAPVAVGWPGGGARGGRMVRWTPQRATGRGGREMRLFFRWIVREASRAGLLGQEERVRTDGHPHQSITGPR